MNTIGIVVVAALAAKIELPPPVARINPTADQIGRQRRQLIVLVFREAIFDRYVAALDIAALGYTAKKRIRKVGSVFSPDAGQEADHRHRQLLRPCAERPRSRRAADERDEIAPFQLRKIHGSPTSPAPRDREQTYTA